MRKTIATCDICNKEMGDNAGVLRLTYKPDDLGQQASTEWTSDSCRDCLLIIVKAIKKAKGGKKCR